MSKLLIPALASIILVCSAPTARPDGFAVKSNLLYDAGLSANLGFEAGVAQRWSVEVSGNFNNWRIGDRQWRHWFGNSTISITASEKGCCDRSEGSAEEAIAIISTEPEIVIGNDFYVLPEVAADEKYNEICGSAFIDFPVNRTEIHDDYRRNSVELARIIATIDTVKSNPDASITDITIKGYASPEGTYANNERFATVRNNVYKLSVTGVKKLGGFKPDEKVEDWDAYFSLNVAVKPWVVRVNNIEF